MYLFEITKVEKIESNNHKMALVKLWIPELGENFYEVFYLINENIPTLASFFRSIGEKEWGVPYKMDWDHLEGKRGLCKLKPIYNTVDEYIYIPEVTDLIQDGEK